MARVEATDETTSPTASIKSSSDGAETMVVRHSSKSPNVSDPFSGEAHQPGADLAYRSWENTTIFATKLRQCITPSPTTVFATHVALNVAAAMIFVCAWPRTNPFPEVYWTYITVILLAMVPVNDTATSIRKTIERLGGTLLGASSSAVLGAFLWLLHDSRVGAASLLTAAIFVESWLWAYCMQQFGKRHLYSAMLAHLTFGLVSIGVYNAGSTRHAIKLAAYRIANVTLGCVINGAVSLLVWPQSTKEFVQGMVDAQFLAAGTSAQGVLQAAHASAGTNHPTPPHYRNVAKFGATRSVRQRRKSSSSSLSKRDDDNDWFQDPVYNATVRGFDSWRHVHDFFPLLQWDPYFAFSTGKKRERFARHINGRAGRAFFLQSTISLVDMLVRTSLYDNRQVPSKEDEEALAFLQKMGDLVYVVLNVKGDIAKRDRAAVELWSGSMKLARIERKKVHEEEARSSFYDADEIFDQIINDPSGRHMSSAFLHDRLHLFYHLSEHLIVRVLRAYAYWKAYQKSPDANSGDNIVDSLHSSHHSDKASVAMEEGKAVDDKNKRPKQSSNSQGADTLFKTLLKPKPFATFFAWRVALVITLSTFFVVVPDPSNPWPLSVIVFFPCAFLSWIPSFDVASTMRMAWQCMYGSAMAATISFGLSPIFWALPDKESTQKAVVAVLMVTHGFILAYIADKTGLRQSFAGTWVIVISGVFLVTFYQGGNSYQPWQSLAYWFINPLIGSALTIGVVMLQCPLSTRKSIEKNATQQIRAAGESAQHVLKEAHDWFGLCNIPLPLHASVRLPRQHKFDRQSKAIYDPAYCTYVGGFESWRNMHALFPRLRYDPLHVFRNDSAAFEHYVCNRSAMVFYLQNTVVLLDTIVRSQVVWKDREAEALTYFAEIGSLLQQMLAAVDSPKAARAEPAEKLLRHLLRRVRQQREALRDKLFQEIDETRFEDLVSFEQLFTSPLRVLANDDQIFLFFHLLEQLIIQAVRLYHYTTLHKEYCICK